MIFSTNGRALSQAPVRKYIKNTCVDVAANWFRWDDEDAPPSKQVTQVWTKCEAACPDLVITSTPKQFFPSSDPGIPPSRREPTAEEERRIKIAEVIAAAGDDKMDHVYLQCLNLLSLSASRSGYAATLPCNGGSESPRMLTLVASPRSFMSSKYLGLSHAAMPLR